MAVTDLHVSNEALEALHPSRLTARPGLVVYDGLGQGVDPLLSKLDCSEHARNFSFGRFTVMNLGFSPGESGPVKTVHVSTGEVAEWELLFRREITDEYSGVVTEKLSIHPPDKPGRQGLVEIKIPKAEMPALIMLPGSHFTPMTRIVEPLSKVLSATLRHDSQRIRPQLVR